MGGRDAGRTGLEGERAAERHLVSRGYRIQARRYRAAGGELDLVAESPDGVLVFVEVKARSGQARTAPLEAVHPLKQRRLALAATHYLQASGRHEAVCRFDVISLIWSAPGAGTAPRIEHLQDAFQVEP